MERGIRLRGQKERQSNGLRERENECLGEMVLAWLKMSAGGNRTAEYFYTNQKV
jgi:hypothetical protein